MTKSSKIRASKQKYVSPGQGVLPCFATPFSRSLSPDNRWVVLASRLPWDLLVSIYQKQMGNDKTGAGGINPRVALGCLIIKHICDLSDRETIQQIRENVYMQYFIGYSSFCDTAPFDPSLFVELRKRLGQEQINAINEQIVRFVQEKSEIDKDKTGKDKEPPVAHQGKMLIDATACPQDIAYPTDLNLLNDARKKSEELIDLLYEKSLHGKKPRTYRRKARKLYLGEAQKKSSTAKAIRKANGKKLAFLRRNLHSIDLLLDSYQGIPLNRTQHKYLLVIHTVFEQQEQMYKSRTHSIEHRIVSIHQPHVRPIIRGKRAAKVEFGAKIQVSLMNGFVFLDDLQWEAFNEGSRLLASVEKYRNRFGYYPAEVMADKIYCTRDNRKLLKGLGIKMRAKPLGRPKVTAVEDHVRPGERNPIEGVFGQSKRAYGMNHINARLARTSGSWIASILMVINLVKLTGLICHAMRLSALTFSASCIFFLKKIFADDIPKNFRWMRVNTKRLAT